MITYNNLENNGRLGNQIFQLAATIALAIRNNDQYIFPTWKYEKDFNLHNCFSNNIKPTQAYAEPFFHYQEIPHHDTKNQILNLVGYWQSYKYFDHCKDTIMDLLTPIHHFDQEPGLCSIHTRRTDYLTKQDCHPLATMKYYQKAMELSGCSKFLVFGDDLKWCKENFKGNQFEFSDEQNPTIDLALMGKKCEHNIIANSSFSWWGAYLNKSLNKKVFYPSNWFGKSLPHNTKDLCPIEWSKI